MNINRQLLNPSLEKLIIEFQKLDKEASSRNDVQGAETLLEMTQKKIHQIESMNASLDGNRMLEAVELERLQYHFRRLKLDLRLAQRKWKRLLSNRERFGKKPEEREYVATFAA